MYTRKAQATREAPRRGQGFALGGFGYPRGLGLSANPEANSESWLSALSGLVGCEIGVAKDARLQFDLLQPTLDRITDADDSYQLALLDDG